MRLRSFHPVLGAVTFLSALAVYSCGSSTSTGATTGGGGAAATTTATTTTSATGTGGHGGAPGAVCPATPPMNGDPCPSFAPGQQCNYGGGLDAGMVSSTECQCANGAGEPTWSCGTEASGTGVGSGGATSSSSSG